MRALVFKRAMDGHVVVDQHTRFICKTEADSEDIRSYSQEMVA